MTSTFSLAATAFRSVFRGKRVLVLENLVLRQQFTIYVRAEECSRFRSTDRVLWVWISKIWDDWKAPLLLVRPGLAVKPIFPNSA